MDTTIYETTQGRIEIQRTIFQTLNITATVDGETIHFQVSLSNLWTFPREIGETSEQHFKRYIMYRVENSIAQKHLAPETEAADDAT